VTAGGAGVPGWLEVAEGVLVLRYPVLDVNSTLVLGDGAALLVDTLSSPRQATELRAAVSAVTAAPVTVVNTHHHFDHCFGNATLRGDAPVWGHARCAQLLRDHGEGLRHSAGTEFPDLAEELAEVTVSPPDHEVRDRAALTVGGRRVELRYAGRGHTDNDLVVLVPDAGVTVVGDLIEVGAPPAFGDSWPLEWPATLSAVLAASAAAGADRVFVPGHGAPTDAAYVRAQHAELAELEWLCRDGHADGAPLAEVARRSPFGPEASRGAVRRAYADLDGKA
jgi:glyoxylase-like metal-dependent hydrolase (beta-lactamase superfamily II)